MLSGAINYPFAELTVLYEAFGICGTMQAFMTFVQLFLFIEDTWNI